MKLGGVEHLFFVSGSELTFYQEAIAKAHAKGRPAPRLVTMTHAHVALNAALGNAMVRNQPAATAVHVDVGTLHYGAAIHTAWRGGYPVLMTAGTGPRAFPGSMRGSRSSSVQWVQEPRDQGEMEDIVPFTPGPGSPSADAKIAWVAIDPVLSRYKTLEFRADLWIPAAVAAVARAVHEAATHMLTHSTMSRIADRRARLEQRKQEMLAHADALAQEDIKHGRLTGRVVSYELASCWSPKLLC
jgi:hypothetical protein